MDDFERLTQEFYRLDEQVGQQAVEAMEAIAHGDSDLAYDRMQNVKSLQQSQSKVLQQMQENIAQQRQFQELQNRLAGQSWLRELWGRLWHGREKKTTKG